MLTFMLSPMQLVKIQSGTPYKTGFVLPRDLRHGVLRVAYTPRGDLEVSILEPFEDPGRIPLTFMRGLDRGV